MVVYFNYYMFSCKRTIGISCTLYCRIHAILNLNNIYIYSILNSITSVKCTSNNYHQQRVIKSKLLSVSPSWKQTTHSVRIILCRKNDVMNLNNLYQYWSTSIIFTKVSTKPNKQTTRNYKKILTILKVFKIKNCVRLLYVVIISRNYL